MTTKKGAGRPNKPPQAKRSVILKARLTRQEAETVRLAAQRRNVTATELLRDGLRCLNLIGE